MDSFGSVWDAADSVADEVSLRALTSARIQTAPVWSFLAAATSPEEFGHRLALHEDFVRQAAADHDVTFEVLAQSLVEDWRQRTALRTEGSFYVTDGGEKVGGPYDTRADAQDAIDGGDVSGDNLSVSGGDGDDADGKDSDGDGEDEDEDDGQDSGDSDGDDSNSDEDDDDKSGEPSDNENPFAKKEGSAQTGTCTRCGDTGVQVVKRSTDDKFVGTDCSCKKTSSLEDRLAAAFPVVAVHSVVHQPGETVFVDHFMGHDEHEGRKGVWAQVVASPGQHGHEDRADSHLLKPMAPGGTHFFHHFGGLNKTAYGDGPTRDHEPYFHGQSGWKSGLGSYPNGHEDTTPGYAWKPHRVYDSLGSAVNHLAGGHAGGIEEVGHHLQSYNHCNSCDHVYSTNHPDHQTAGHKDVCPNCNDTDFHETAADVYHESHDGEHDGAGEAHSEDNYGDPYGKMDRRIESSKKTALADGVDPLAWIISTVPGGEGQAEKEAQHDEAVHLSSLVALFRTATATE